MLHGAQGITSKKRFHKNVESWRVLLSVAEYSRVMKNVLQGVIKCCTMLLSVAQCCSVLQGVLGITI